MLAATVFPLRFAAGYFPAPLNTMASNARLYGFPAAFRGGLRAASPADRAPSVRLCRTLLRPALLPSASAGYGRHSRCARPRSGCAGRCLHPLNTVASNARRYGFPAADRGGLFPCALEYRGEQCSPLRFSLLRFVAGYFPAPRSPLPAPLITVASNARRYGFPAAFGRGLFPCSLENHGEQCSPLQFSCSVSSRAIPLLPAPHSLLPNLPPTLPPSSRPARRCCRPAECSRPGCRRR